MLHPELVFVFPFDSRGGRSVFGRENTVSFFIFK